MKKDEINILVKEGQLRPRFIDKERIATMILSSKINADVAKRILLDDNSATLIFREVYESVRQLGDANWWKLGYEPRNHDVSMDILKESDIKDRVLLNNLNRFKKIRNDANYRAFRVSVEQAKEILEFWNKCAEEIIKELKKDG